MARGKSVIQVVITGESRGLRRATDAAAGALGGFALVGAKVVSTAASIASAIGIASVKAFADFDAAMTKSLAIMGDVSQSMEADMAAAAREVAKTTLFSAEQAAESYFFLASAGLDAAQSIQALPKVAQFAQAGMFDMALATDLLTDAQSALGMTIRDDAVKNMQNMSRVADVLVKANTLANASVQQFSESLTNKAGAALSVANKGIEEGVAVLAAFADQGVKGAEAGERLSVMLRDITRAGAANADEFAKLGLQVFDASGNLRNMADVVGEFERVLGPMSDAQKAATLDTLGLTRSVADNIKLVLGASDQIRDYEKALLDAGGTTEDVAEKQLQTLSSQLQIMRSNIADATLEIGGSLQPATDTLAAFLGNIVIPRIGDLATAFRENVAPAINDFVIQALGDLNRDLHDSDGVIATVRDSFSMYVDVIRENVMPVLGELWALISGPVKSNFLTFRDVIKDEVMPRFGDFLSGVGTLIESFTTWYQNVAPEVNRVFSEIAAPVVVIYDNLAGIVTDLGEMAQKFNDANEPGTIFSLVLNSIATDIVVIATWIGDVTEGINKFTSALNRLADSSGFTALNRLTDLLGGTAGLRRALGLDPQVIADRLRQGYQFFREGLLPSPLRFTRPGELAPPGFFERNEFMRPSSSGNRPAGAITVIVNGGDPDQVIQALQRYTRQNGPLGQVVRL